MTSFNETMTMTVITCCSCSIMFAVPDDMYRRLQREGEDEGPVFYCPNGHRQVFSETNEMKLRKQLNQTQQKLSSAQFELMAAQNKVMKLNKRIKNGICPCCHRQFASVQRHMQHMHPDFAPEEVKSNVKKHR